MKKFKKSFIVLIIALVTAIYMQGYFTTAGFKENKTVLAYNEQKLTVKLDGKAVAFPDAQPYVNEDSRTMVPVRFVSEALGCKVTWEVTKEIVTINKGDTRILLHIGDNSAIVNTKESDTRKEFDTKAILKDDRTMVPLRFVSETLGAGVSWDEASNTVIIRSDGTVEVVATAVPKFTPIIIDHSNDNATPQPSPTPDTNPYKNLEEKLDLVEGFDAPADFVVPQMRIIHNWDHDKASWFDINLDNLLDYQDKGNYSIKASCTNVDLTNTMIDSNGEKQRLDKWKDPMASIGHHAKTLILWAAYKTAYYETWWQTKEEALKLKDGDVLEIEVTIKNDSYQQVYRKFITVHIPREN